MGRDTEKEFQEIAERVKMRRMELGLSYKALADRTGLNKSTLQRYETGSIKCIPIGHLKILAAGLSTPPEWIIGLNAPKEVRDYRSESIMVTPLEKELLSRFREANDTYKEVICKILDVTEERR